MCVYIKVCLCVHIYKFILNTSMRLPYRHLTVIHVTFRKSPNMTITSHYLQDVSDFILLVFLPILLNFIT